MELSSPEAWRWIWLTAVMLFTLGELALAGTFFLAPFALGAGAACVTAFLGAPVAVEWGVFVGVSLAGTAALRPLARRLDSSSPHAAIGGNRWTGRTAVVVQEIGRGSGAIGMVRLDNEEWRAQSEYGEPIPAGAHVVVSRVDGTRLIVREQWALE